MKSTKIVVGLLATLSIIMTVYMYYTDSAFIGPIYKAGDDSPHEKSLFKAPALLFINIVLFIMWILIIKGTKKKKAT